MADFFGIMIINLQYLILRMFIFMKLGGNELKDVIKKSDKIALVYEQKMLEDLEGKLETIQRNLKSSLEELCVQSGITTSNSVYHEIFPFSLIFRVKKGESLKEKVIRKYLYEDIYDSDSSKIVENIYSKVNDLIGITILIDTNKNLESFANFLYQGKINEIEAITPKADALSTLGDLKYYNIKANYKKMQEVVPIEIQIKSTVVSAFTNIQHKLIYKNKDVSIMRDNNDRILKSVTPSVIAIENIIDSVEESFTSSEEVVETYQRQKKIKQLILGKVEGTSDFDSFIKDIDTIINRSLQGKLIKSGGTDKEKEEEFWKSLCEEKEVLDFSSNQEDFIIKILTYVCKIDFEFISNIIYYDYFVNHEIGKKDYLDSVYLAQIDEILDFISLLGKQNNYIYEKILLGSNKRYVVNDIETILSIISEFLEEEEVSEDQKKEIIEKAALFSFDFEKSITIGYSIELDQSINILEEKLRAERSVQDEKNS